MSGSPVVGSFHSYDVYGIHKYHLNTVKPTDLQFRDINFTNNEAHDK